MAEFHLLAPARGEHKASAVFIHGLGGDPYETWTSGSAVWPAWLAEEIDGLAVWLVGYDAPASEWQGGGMHPVDHATAILSRLYIEPALAKGDLYLIGHSLGGLIIKMMMRRAEMNDKSGTEAKSFLQRVRKVAFLATPHTGADLAQIANLLRVLARPSEATEALRRNDPNLRELTEGYRKIARDRAVDHLVLTERLPLVLKGWKWGVIPYRIPLGVIVQPDSGDPGLAVDPIPIAVDHIEIAKPRDRNDEIYLHVRAFLARAAAPPPLDPGEEVQRAAIRNEELHDRTFDRLEALEEAFAREKGVPPEVLKPLFEKLGEMNLTLDEMREKAEWAVAQILAQSVEAQPKSNLGGDLDAVIAKARALLRELRTAEALKLLYEDDEADKEEAQRLAARRLVRLSEIARIQKATFDYAAAKQTFRDIAMLDPTNAWPLLELGDLERISGTTGDALAAYSAGLATTRAAKDEPNIGLFLERVGDVLLSRNDLEGAFKNYREGLDIRRRLMDADPTHAERARDVSVSVNKIGDVLRSRNDLEGALKNYREGLDIRRRLMDADPTHAERARDVALSLLRVGQVEVAREVGAACGYFRQARDIIAALARQAPDVHVYNNDLAWIDAQIAAHCGK